MAPNRGIAAHFAPTKATISRNNSNRSAKGRIVKDDAAASSKVSTASELSSASTSDNVAQPKSSASVASPPKPTTPKKPVARRTTRTRLRTPDEGEVDRIMAEIQASPSLPPPAPVLSEGASLELLGTPPTTPRARSARFSPLLEPTTISPISVRTDPDTNKMFLRLPPRSSPSKPTTSTPTASTSSPTKRKNTTPPKNSSPTKTPRTLDGTPRRLITGEAEMFGTEEEDGLVLTPGRSKGTRIALGSPSKSPLLARLGDTPKEQALRRIVDEDEEGGVITPRGVRERAKGLALPAMATANAAAVFRGASIPSLSSAPKLALRKVEEQTGSSSTSFSSGLSHADIEESTTAQEVELPALKHILSSDLPLPSFYSSLMSLHVALEHALVVHLATAGCASATLQSSTTTSSDSDSDSSLTPTKSRTERKNTKNVRLPNLIPYSTLRPLVERSGGRRLGPTELRRLASVWLDFQKSSSNATDEAPEEVRGLGFIITKTRSLDPRTGRRALDWGLGIELEIKRTVRERTPPTQVNFGGVELASSPVVPQSEAFGEKLLGTPKLPSTRCTTPPPSGERKIPRSPYIGSSSSPLLTSPSRRRGGVTRAGSPTPGSPKMRSSTSGTAKARESMSVVALWNNGLETRKAEVGRRLRERCGRFHQLWLDENGISVPASPATHSSSVKVEAGEPSTPSRPRMVGLGIATPRDDSDAEVDSAPPPPREVIMGAGGLLTPSATRSGGRRVGKRTFHMDPAQLDGHTFSSGEEDEDDLPSHFHVRAEGKQSLIDEVSHSVVRSSKSMPSLKASVKDVKGEEEAGPIPAEGSQLNSWHPDFSFNDPTVVHPIPLATLPSLTAALATPRHNKDKSLLDPALLTPKKPVKFTTNSSLTPQPASGVPNTAGMSLRERIAAKEQLRRTSSLPSLAAASSSNSSSSSTSLTPMQALSQRALVSRLPELCSILFMLFSNGTTLSSTGITRSPTIPMNDLLAKLSKSVKIQLSPRECRQSIEVLQKVAPGFLVVITPSDAGTAGGKEYVRLGNNEQTGALWRLNEVRQRIALELNGR